MIEATVGSGYRGDIAIDDVTMTSGSCSQGMALTCRIQVIEMQEYRDLTCIFMY